MTADEYSPLGLAYIGDAVYELLIRSRVMSGGQKPVGALHNASANSARASSQATAYMLLMDSGRLTEKEVEILKRGRNAKSASRAKNASVIDYRHATGLEALFGYLYLSGDEERIKELFELCEQI